MSNSFIITDNDHRKRLVFRLAAEKNQTLGQFFQQWGGVMAHDLIDWTPPRPRKAVKANWPQQKKAGEMALERDIRKVFHGPDDLINVLGQHSWVGRNQRLFQRLADLVRAGDHVNLVRVLYKIGMKIQIIPAPLQAQHEAERRYRGTVKRPRNRYYLLSERPITGYVNIRKVSVGKLKSGWISAAAKAGLKRVVDVPAWVARHRDPGTGRGNFRGPNFEVYLVNRSKAAKDKDPNDIVRPAMAILERKMQKSLLAVMGKWSRKYGFTRPF